MAITFQKATKKQAKLRMSIHGASGSGKSFSSLAIARHIVGPQGKVALLDTERGSAAKYSDKFDFDTCEVSGNYHPDKLLEAIDGAAEAGYEIMIVDSLSHFWNGPGGVLELVDEEVKKQKARGHKPDSFAAWKVGDAVYKRVVQKIVGAPIHLILTMRAKQEYVKEEGQNGKTTIRKVGLAPEMRDAFIYEADVEGMLDIEHNLVIGKTRCDALDGKVFTKPGKDIADILRAWLSDGAAVDVAAPKTNGAPMPLPEVAAASREVSEAAAEAAAEQALADEEIRRAYSSVESKAAMAEIDARVAALKPQGERRARLLATRADAAKRLAETAA